MTTRTDAEPRAHTDFEAAYHFAELKAGDCHWEVPGEGRGDEDLDPCIAKARRMQRALTGLADQYMRVALAREHAEFADVLERMR
jgi:hypothetical protein